MPPPLIVDLDKIDADNLLYTREQIYARLPQAYEFAQLDGVVHMDLEKGEGAAFRDVKPGEWWCRGHIPGRPIFPGVLMLESAAQMAAFFTKYLAGYQGFVAFGGVDKCKFREAVIPPARIYFLCKKIEDRPRRVICQTQGVVNGAIVFEAIITGMPVPNLT